MRFHNVEKLFRGVIMGFVALSEGVHAIGHVLLCNPGTPSNPLSAGICLQANQILIASASPKCQSSNVVNLGLVSII